MINRTEKRKALLCIFYSPESLIYDNIKIMKETKIKDLEIYNLRMDKSIEDKLWFIDKVEETDIFVDFGCGAGTLLKELYKIYGKTKKYIGYDNNLDMLCIARNNCKNTTIVFGHFFDQIKKYIDQNYPGEKVCLIMSSVLHEIYSYCSEDEILKIWKDIENKLKPDYIAIRDMTYGIDDYYLCKYPSNIIKSKLQEIYYRVYQIANPDQLKDFENNTIYFGLDKLRDLTHFLLKYKYTENWEREVKEDYLSCPAPDAYLSKYSINYRKEYCLPYLHKQFKKDFGIDFIGTTHYNLLLEKI